jgi:hypothetical protein
MLQARFQFPIRPLDFSTYLILPAALWPWVWLSFWQKWVPGIFVGVEVGQHVRLTASPPSVSWLARKCGSLDISQSYWLPLPVTEIALLNYVLTFTMPWMHMGNWKYSSTILDFGIRRIWVVRFTPLQLYPRIKPLGTHWIGSWVGPICEEENNLALLGIEPWPSSQ